MNQREREQEVIKQQNKRTGGIGRGKNSAIDQDVDLSRADMDSEKPREDRKRARKPCPLCGGYH